MMHNNNLPDWQHTTTENDAEWPQSFLQQVRKILNGKKAKREREGEGIVCDGTELPRVAGAGQTSGESNWGLIWRRMHCQSCPGLSSKWELVHYGSAARYFTAVYEIGQDDVVFVTDKWQDNLLQSVSSLCIGLFHVMFDIFGIHLIPRMIKCWLLTVEMSRNMVTHSARSQLLKISYIGLCQPSKLSKLCAVVFSLSGCVNIVSYNNHFTVCSSVSRYYHMG